MTAHVPEKQEDELRQASSILTSDTGRDFRVATDISLEDTGPSLSMSLIRRQPHTVVQLCFSKKIVSYDHEYVVRACYMVHE